jgi:acyl-ACP thioesterase
VPKNEELCEFGERRIVYSDLDYNMHMNNTKYADMLCDFIPLEEVSRLRGMSLTYLHEARFGDTIRLLGQKSDEGYLFRTVNEEGTSCIEAQVIIG